MNRYSHLPHNVVILSFEGPDRYSFVGGLGVRVTELAAALGRSGFSTNVFFIGDPDKPGIEPWTQNVRLYRWCQWISAYHPGGVYDGEGGKIADFSGSAPPYIVSEIVKPAHERGERVLVLAEDWQVVPATLHLHRALLEAGLRESATLVWNANNTYGFETIDWRALERAAIITGVSRYMKFELGLRDVQALVVPNGIPEELPESVDDAAVDVLKDALHGRKALLKVGRYDPDKRWLQAIDAVAEMRDAGVRVQLIVRGGKEAYGDLVFARARTRGLAIEDVTVPECSPHRLAGALEKTAADIVNLRSFLPNETLYALYGAVDAVLANSGKEPFGLVGLEVMACGGIPVCGSTGEDYARAFENAIVCDTGDPAELASYLRQLFDDKHLASRIRKRAAKTARRYAWPAVFELLDAKLAYQELT
ncbi:MAG TPA: glycosyltransferase family 4 protein [Candidatus Baltobacteraceae bacterium]|nr:glycosyltransferase family 4 protein [Candidatus Baltobacteraceae bacterium]